MKGQRCWPVAMMPMAVRYSQEARMYALMGMLIIAATMALVMYKMPDPELTIHFDVNQQQAVQTRERILAQVAREGDWGPQPISHSPGWGT
ncbi:Predicted membrane protein [Serratia quinivorans]|nr:Predicted membrane protein [Serratia quinivorans]